MQIIEQRTNLRVKYLILLLFLTFSSFPGFRVFAHFLNLSARYLKNRLSDWAQIFRQSFYINSAYDERGNSKNLLF